MRSRALAIARAIPSARAARGSEFASAGSDHSHRAPIAATAARARRASVSQSAPLTPTPPMHSPRRGPDSRPPSRSSARGLRRAPAQAHAPCRAIARRRPAPGRPPAGGRAHRLGGRRMHGVEPAAVHAVERDDMPAGVADRAGNGDAGLGRFHQRCRHHGARPGVSEPFAVGEVLVAHASCRFSQSTMVVVMCSDGWPGVRPMWWPSG